MLNLSNEKNIEKKSFNLSYEIMKNVKKENDSDALKLGSQKSFDDFAATMTDMFVIEVVLMLKLSQWEFVSSHDASDIS